MPSLLQLRLFVPVSPLNCVPNYLSRPLCAYNVDGDLLQPSTFQSNYRISLMKIKSHSFIVANSFSRSQSAGTLQISVNERESTQIAFKSEVSASLSWNHTIDEGSKIDSASHYLASLGMESDKETERRRKISLANKGRAPWNKGRKHTAETRELIKQRTIEALKDPKVRKKMFGGHHPHSEEIKEKISLGQKRIWRKRFKLRNIREKFYFIWAEKIAEAAKQGWWDQEELEWDSYAELTAQIALQQLQLEANKNKAKGMEKSRATKVGKKKAVHGDVTTSSQPPIENLDLEMIRRGKSRRELSLANQIQAAKMKRAESATMEALV